MREFEPGTKVRHFKAFEEIEGIPKLTRRLKYTYMVLDNNIVDATTDKRKVLYKNLIDDITYVRDYDEFYSEVDRNKYPNAKSPYRFISVDEEIELHLNVV